MAGDSNGLKSALRPLGAALIGAGVALALATGGNIVIGATLAVVGVVLVFVGGVAAAPPPPPPPPPPSPPPPPIPRPGDSVSAVSAFGTASSAGSSAQYARADHDHGLPALPEPAALGGDVAGPPAATRVSALQGVPVDVAGAAPGAVLTFDAGRWTARPLPPPPPPPPPVVLPSPGGDLEGELARARVQSLQGTALQATGAQPGQVLAFDGQGWKPAALPAPPPPPPPPPTDFVGRGDKPMRIVAAGEVELRLNNGVSTLAPGTAYGGLRAVAATRGQATGEWLLVLQAADAPNAGGEAYNVQLTPGRATGSSAVFTAGMQGGVINDGAGAIRFTAVLAAGSQINDGQFVLRLSVLVTRFAA